MELNFIQIGTGTRKEKTLKSNIENGSKRERSRKRTEAWICASQNIAWFCYSALLNAQKRETLALVMVEEIFN